MHILVTHHSVDTATYKMLGDLSLSKDWKIYITYANDKQKAAICGNCIPLELPEITSKFTWSSMIALRQYIKSYAIDVIYSHSTSGLSNALFASLGTSAVNVGYRGTQARVRRLDPTYYMALLNPRTKHIVCETADIKTYLSQFIASKKLSVATKPFDLQWIAAAEAEPKVVPQIPTKAFKCIYIGACKGRPYKGLHHMLKAFKLLQGKAAYLTIIGSYDEEEKVFAHDDDWGKEHIIFLGQRSDAIHYLPHQDLFLLPSARDASPRVVREAMACGVPCIVNNIPGARDLIIDGKTGLLVNKDCPKEMADAILHLMEHQEELTAMKEACKPHIEKNFNPKDYVSYFEHLFSTL